MTIAIHTLESLMETHGQGRRNNKQQIDSLLI